MKKERTDDIHIAAGQFTREGDYWLNKLSGDLVKSNFPYDAAPTDASSISAQAGTAAVATRFPDELFRRLMQLRNEADPRLFMVLAAGVTILLRKYSGNNDIVIGAPIFKQDREGHFVNTVLALRNYVDDTADTFTFKNLLLQVRQTVTEADENQNYPMETLLYKLGITYLREESPLFDTVVLLENIHDRNYLTPEKPNVLFVFRREEDHLELETVYNPSLYQRDTIGRIAAHLIRLLEQAVFNVDIPVNRIDMLSARERQTVLEEFNHAHVSIPPSSHPTICQWFERQVEQMPENIAVVVEKRRLTYRELNRRANQVARLLREKGVRENTVVGIMVDRCIEMIPGILAILKAGGAYLPLDPYIPRDRCNYVLRDSDIERLLTKKQFMEGIDESVTLMDLGDPELYNGPGENLENINTPGGCVYVISTSGSTGRPKGIMVNHDSFVDFLEWAVVEFEHKPGYQVLLSNSYAFDGSIQQIFPPLVSGGTLHLIQPEVRLDTNVYLDYLGEHKINNIDEVPVVMNELFEKAELDENRELLPDMTCLSLGSEFVPMDMVRNCRKYLNHGGRIINAYGPAEASVETTTYHFDGRDESEKSVIGSPRRNLRIYIRDGHGNSCPIGVPGEICVSGMGLARGYLNRPELTAEKFTANPFAEAPFHRLYKAGDLGRWLPDGNIEFLGRIDHQVKIRGYRIELEEIECRLLRHEMIVETVVTARETDAGDKYLCAYVVPREPGEIAPADLRKYLVAQLPDYMIPSYFVTLDALPLTPNDKVDRNALPDPTAGGDMDSQYAPPQTPIEEILVEIWQAVLGREAIGVNDNFFMIGGDSIKSIQILSRLNKVGYKVDMRDIFQYPTIGELTHTVRKLERRADQSAVTGGCPLTPGQTEFFQRIKIDSHHFNQAVMLYAEKGFDAEAVKAVFNRLQDHHDMLRATYTRGGAKGEDIVQTLHEIGYPLDFREYDYRDMESRETAVKTLTQEADKIQAGIGLEKGPLMKLALFHLEDGDRLLVVCHHLVIDGISWRILFEDIETLYQQHVTGKPLQLPMKSDSFKLWAEELSKYADNEAFLEKDKPWWKQMEASHVPSIEKDFNGTNLVKDGVMVSELLSEEETTLLQTRVNDAYGTEINDILLTAFGLAVRNSFGHSKVLIALEGHGREEVLEDVNINRTIGWFTSIYPVVLEVPGGEDLPRRIKEVKETLHRVPERGIGYGILKYLTGERHKEDIEFKLNPQVIFNYLGQFDVDVKQMSFGVARESHGHTYSPYGHREYELDVSGMITGNRLTLSIIFSKEQYKVENMERLVSGFKENLSRIIAHCTGREEKELTPSDFTYNQLSIDDVDELEAMFEN
ncbi:MAG: amino acid adenylation domain-containing protein [bacterium]|nr:amino acid adenylation domain-containing protein [bacterium]